MGRPSSYTAAKALQVCQAIASGKSLHTIDLDPKMPPARTIYAWLEAHPDFQRQYARAREQQADLYAAQVIEIADTAVEGEKIETTIDEKGKEVVKKIRGDMVERSRLRADARRWYASKLAPRKYGDKLELAGDPENPILVASIEARLIAARRRVAELPRALPAPAEDER